MKKIVCMFLVFTTILSCVCVINASAATGQDIVNDLNNNYVGKYPYVLNTHGPNTFDCSGLVYYVYKQHGVTLPYTTGADWTKYGTVITDRNQLKSGDILLFGSSRNNLNHIGIYDANGGYIIHALNSRYGIIRKPKLSEWVSSSSWNSNGSNQFQFALRVLGGGTSGVIPSSTGTPYISDTSRTLRWKELNSVYDKTTEELQKCLNYIMDAGLVVDGKYGKATHDVVKEFQGKYGLKVDGDAGPMTLNKVNEVIKGVHTHSFSIKSETTHPHKEYKICSCGEKQYTGNNVSVNSCSQCTTPGKPELLNMKKQYYDDKEIKFTWNPTENTTHYNLYIHKKNKRGEYETFENIFYAESGMTINLETGDYKVWLQPTNSNAWTDDNSTWRYTNSDIYYFEVTERHSHTYKERYDKEHPHNIYKECVCGDIMYLEKTKKVKSCEECYPIKGTKTIKLQIGIPNMFVDGQAQEIDPGRGTAPVLKNARTMLPIRAIVESFGAYVIWDEEEEKVTIYTNDVTMQFWINNTKAVVNNKTHIMDAEPIIINGRTFMPLRFIAENMGLDVGWNDSNQTVIIEGSL